MKYKNENLIINKEELLNYAALVTQMADKMNVTYLFNDGGDVVLDTDDMKSLMDNSLPALILMEILQEAGLLDEFMKTMPFPDYEDFTLTTYCSFLDRIQHLCIMAEEGYLTNKRNEEFIKKIEEQYTGSEEASDALPANSFLA